MGERWTIPAAVLGVLGGLEDDDPPVLVGTGEHGPSRLCPWHPLLESVPAIPDHAVIVLPASSPALLRVLARHAGLVPSPGWVPNLTGGLGTLRLWELVDYWSRGVWCSEPHDSQIGQHATIVPTLAGVTDPTQALAEVVVWTARVERLLDFGRDDPAWGVQRVHG